MRVQPLANAIVTFVLAQSTEVLGRPGVLDQITMLEQSNSTLLQYPTQFTQNIVPKQIHSHNDYWRDVPLLTALSFGVASVEADVWFIDNTLFYDSRFRSIFHTLY
ncbi:MAG: hypothetical protein NXY57DRAFT_1025612 [Lentinula lateritia]|nr:MAG: hypothetical protein NXY57DRAFT_1025612 [Lentinula lateritia]